MKKKILYSFLTLVTLLALAVISLPFLIESEKIQQQIIQRIEECYLVDASVKEVQLSYFPLPHIDLFAVDVHHDTFNLSTPEIKIFPSWKVLIGQAEVGRVYLEEPQVSLLQGLFVSRDQQPNELIFSGESLPGISLFINDGYVQFPQVTTGIGVLHNGTLTHIEAKVAIKNNMIALELDSQASFAENLNLDATLSLKDLTSKGVVALKHLDLSKLSQTPSASPLAFISDSSDLSSSYQYGPAKGFSLSFKGDIPDFTLTGPDLGEKAPVPIRIQAGNFNIVIKKDLLQIDIQALDVSEPALQLQGTCAYYLPEDGKDRHVKLDLQGKNIDATSLRHKLLDLVGSNIVAKTVCQIVQSGYANSASYYFDDTIASFADINTMTIDVDIERTDIHLKYVPLDLHNAKGLIRIKDGDLTGWDITTEVGGSKGSNGSFLVGLGRNNWGLGVDVDIDADLPALPQILREIIHNKNVVEELQLVSATGRSDAHLHIGDDLRDFKIVVDVNSFSDPEIRYDRLSWPIIPLHGKLQVTETGANWQDLALNIGNHLIRQTSGHILWTEPTIPFELTSLDGIFDNNTMLTELKSYDKLKPTLDSVITEMVGATQLAGKIKGHLFTPKNYIYDVETVMKKMSIKSPRLPGQLDIDAAHVRITDKDMDIHELTGILLGDSLQINGGLAHDTWMTWTGDLVFNGTVQQPLMDWFKDEEMVPEKLEINAPSTIKNMRVKWQNKEILIAGALHPLETESDLQFQVNQTKGIFTGEFNIDHQNEKSQIRFFIDPAKDTYDLSLTGTLPGQAFIDLLADPFIQFESITGSMDIHASFPAEGTTPVMTFSGDLTSTKLNLLIGDLQSPDHTITFSLTGKDNILTINKFDINYEHDLLHTQGQFKNEGWSGSLHMTMQSPFINTDRVEQIVEHLNTFIYDRLGVKKNTETYQSRYYLTSELDFNFEKFTIPFGKSDQDGKDYHFPLTPLVGRYSFNNSNSSLKIKDSMVCGLNVEAFLAWFGEHETSKEVSIQSPENTTIELREFLECFNLDAVIDGPMTFKAEAKTQKGTVKEGHFSLISEKGNIYKFAAVAKAISILNIKGWSGSIWEKGYSYNKLELSGIIENDVLRISKLFIDGDGVDIVGKGTFDLRSMELDMVFYVVPFTTIGGFVTKVPIVGRLLGGKEGRIVSVPVKITGPALDPEVSVLDAGEIGEATGKWIWDTVTIPFDWVSTTDTEEDLDLKNPEELSIIPKGQ